MRTLLLCLFLSSTLLAQGRFTPMFNGRNFDGWVVHTAHVWWAREGMIVGKSPGIEYNEFLRTPREYSDFILKLSFRLVDGKGNSGIQFRSKAVPNSHGVSGYQADIGEKYWGSLYDEARRNKVLAQASPKSIATLKSDGWNEYVITARGNRITLDLNGVRTVDYTEKDPSIDKTGIIALQVHSGAPMEVQFKDLQIQELK